MRPHSHKDYKKDINELYKSPPVVVAGNMNRGLIRVSSEAHRGTQRKSCVVCVSKMRSPWITWGMTWLSFSGKSRKSNKKQHLKSENMVFLLFDSLKKARENREMFRNCWIICCLFGWTDKMWHEMQINVLGEYCRQTTAWIHSIYINSQPFPKNIRLMPKNLNLSSHSRSENQLFLLAPRWTLLIPLLLVAPSAVCPAFVGWWCNGLVVASVLACSESQSKVPNGEKQHGLQKKMMDMYQFGTKL